MTVASARPLPADLPTGLFLDGRWRPAASGATFDVLDPATGELLAKVADASPAEGLAALDAAHDAFAGWSATAPRRRSDILRRAFDLVMRDADRIARLITLEMGKPLKESRAEVVYGAEFLRWFSEEAVRIAGRYGPSPEGTGTMTISRHAVGPALLITPWNFPLAMATRKIAPALAAGCTVVIKPAELTPLTTLYFTGLLEEAGLPPGVVNVIPTSRSDEVTGPIIADRRLRKLSFTGSTRVGRILLRKAADNVLRTSMELGGNAPFVLFEDADVEAAADAAMLAKFRNIGQACTAANRFIVHAGVADAFAQAVVRRVRDFRIGSGLDPEVTIGPLIDRKAVANCLRLVEDAVARGATVATGGRALDRPGTFFEPTVLAGVRPGSLLLEEEIFGPILPIQTFETEAEAVRLANDTEYGLVAYVFTRDAARMQRLAEALETGMLGWNVGVLSNAAAPFGGVKMSGLGREGGAEGIDEYLATRYMLAPRAAPD